MRLFILDSGLGDKSGHDFLFARLVGEEAQRRGIDVQVLCHKDFPDGEDYPFRSVRIFNSSYYYDIGRDPVTIPVLSMHKLNADFLVDMRAIAKNRLRKDDLIWVPSINQRNLAGLKQWLLAFDPAARPAILINLLFPSGVHECRGEITVYDSLRAVQYRRILAEPDFGPHVHLAAMGPVVDGYRYLSRYPVVRHPLLIDLTRPVSAPAPQTLLLFAGNAVKEKGIERIPELVRLLARALPDWKLLVQANDTTEYSMKEPVAELRAMSASVAALELHTGRIDEEDYHRLIDTAHVIVLPYDAQAYRYQTSGVLWEAIAAGRVVGLPAGTNIEEDAASWEADYVAIDTSSAQSIADGLIGALEHGAPDRELAEAAARRFRAENGAGPFLDMLLALRRTG